MEKDRIIQNINKLRERHYQEEPKDNQIWEGEECGVSFGVTKDKLPIAESMSMYVLSLSGRKMGIKSLARDFQDTLGMPLSEIKDPYSSETIYLTWLDCDVEKFLALGR